MNSSKIIEILTRIIDSSSRNLVGKLCKRCEILESNKSLSPDLFKSIAKELVYEESRNTKQMLRSVFIPSIKFVTEKSKEIK